MATSRVYERAKEIFKQKRETSSSDLLLCIVGPTASGKTELSLQFARDFDGEIVSADSVQVYRYFDLGSAKPSLVEREQTPHHLIDILEPEQNIDACHYAKLADKAISDIRGRHKFPIVCGGSFLWVKSLVYGLLEAPEKNDELREEYKKLVAREGAHVLHARLAKCDLVSAQKLHPHDFIRVSRALEVYELTGKKMSDLQAKHGFSKKRHEVLFFSRRYSLDELTERIQKRAMFWLDQGWIDETKLLLEKGYASCRAMQSVGYKEISTFLLKQSEGPIHLTDAKKVLQDQIVHNTRIFARRQRTWLSSHPIEWLDESL